jgi:hypothetical protein
MSEYFKNKSDGREFGPAPTGYILYLVVEDIPGRPLRETRMCYVTAKTGFEAREIARRTIPDFVDSGFVCYPNPVRFEAK